MERIRKDFNTLTLVTIPVAIAINIAIGTIVYNVKVPLYLDSVGTVLVGVLAGPIAGAVTGLLSNLIWGIIPIPLVQNPNYVPFMAVAAVIGALAGLFGESGWLKVWWKVIFAGVITGIIAAMISAPISAYVFGGVTGSGTDLLNAFYKSFGLGILPAAFAQGASSDPLDKTITYLLVWIIVMSLPRRFLALFPRAESVSGQPAVPVMPAMPGSGVTVPSQMPAASTSTAGESEMAGVASVQDGAPGTPAVTKKRPAAKKPAATAAKKPATAKKPAGGKTPAKPKPKARTTKR